jgi:hypothetical protein
VKETSPPSTPSGSPEELNHTINGLVNGWRGGALLLNERLSILGAPRATGSGAVRTIFATDQHGAPVVVSATPALVPGAAVDIARRLTALEKRLRAEAQERTTGRVILLCWEPPSLLAWRALSAQLGPRGKDVYLKQGRATVRLQPPSELAAGGLRLPGSGEWSVTDWIAAGALVLGILLTLLGLRGMAG